jgi:hypothetical protein
MNKKNMETTKIRAYPYVGEWESFELEIETALPPGRRDRIFCVVYFPWQGKDNVVSYHASPQAAWRAAKRYKEEFHRVNGSGAYGHSWVAGRILED